jgi:uncharacterized membrane protein
MWLILLMPIVMIAAYASFGVLIHFAGNVIRITDDESKTK